MSDQIVSVVKTGIVLQGKGASAGATVLLSKPVNNEPHCTIVLCHAPASPHHPYVVWTYNEISGACHSGDYFDNQTEAAARFAERTW
jgi:hypothetical protein